MGKRIYCSCHVKPLLKAFAKLREGAFFIGGGGGPGLRRGGFLVFFFYKLGRVKPVLFSTGGGS